MTRKQRVDLFDTELTKFLNKSIRELDLTWAELIGVLFLKLNKLATNANKENEA